MLVRFGLLIPPPHQFEDLGGTEKCIAKSVPNDFYALQRPEDEWIKISIFRRRHIHAFDLEPCIHRLDGNLHFASSDRACSQSQRRKCGVMFNKQAAATSFCPCRSGHFAPKVPLPTGAWNRALLQKGLAQAARSNFAEGNG
jgi:hypothetical protein